MCPHAHNCSSLPPRAHALGAALQSEMSGGSLDEAGDSADLQALFDSIAAQPADRPASGQSRETHVEVVGGTATSADTPELEALFDSGPGRRRSPPPRRRHRETRPPPTAARTSSSASAT